MEARSIIQVTVVAVVLLALSGVLHTPAQAATMVSIVPAGGGSETSSIRILPPVDRSDPSAMFDWFIRLTLVVIVVSAGIGAMGSLLTRAAPSGASRS